MHKDLKSQINSIPPNEYIAARSFLDRVLYASAKAQL
jgi:hypothetical protein